MIRWRDYFDYEYMLNLYNIRNIITQHSPHEPFIWIDMCCGDGGAIKSLVYFILNKNGLLDRVRLIGVDKGYIGFDPVKNVEFHPNTDATTYFHPENVDLITCVYGLHSIEHKLEALANWYSQLREGGILAFNIHNEYLEIVENDGIMSLSDLIGHHENVQIRHSKEDGDFFKITAVQSMKTPDMHVRFMGTRSPRKHILGYQAPCSLYLKETS